MALLNEIKVPMLSFLAKKRKKIKRKEKIRLEPKLCTTVTTICRPDHNTATPILKVLLSELLRDMSLCCWTVALHVAVSFLRQARRGQPGPEVIKLFSCSTQLSTKFQLLIKTKILTNKEVSCFKSLICCIYHADKC